MNPLLVPELFYCVLKCFPVSSDSENHGERRALFALARTCSAFSEPCLDQLWRCLDSLLPLIQNYAGFVDEDTVKVPPSPQQWLIINRYLPRIRELTLPREDLSLRFLECTRPILPNLRLLRWRRRCGRTNITEKEVVSLSHIWPLLTPNITTLEVEICELSEPESQAFLQNYFLLCPNLKSFKLNSDISQLDKIGTEALSRAICSRGDWQRVELSCIIDNTALRHLALSPTLEVVSLTLAPPNEVFFRSAEIPFRNAKRLAFKAWDCFDVIPRLLRAQDQAFCAVHVTGVIDPLLAVDMASFLTAVASPRRILSLESLVVGGNLHCVQDQLPLLSYDAFRPLTSLIHLRELVFKVKLQLSINDDEFADLVHNWPCLEVFCWQCMPRKPMISINSLFSLLSIAQSYTKLACL